MRSNTLNAVLKTAAIAGLLLTAGVSSAQVTHEVFLQAQSFDKSIDDGNGGSYPVKMWGFASCNNDFTVCDAATSPGPQIDAAVGDTVNIHVSNSLLNMPVSIIIPGQGGAGNPVPMTSAPSRVGSMTHEAAPGGGTADYSFTVSKPGTFIYQSASYASLEVPMGLYGALVVNVAAGQAYGDVSYDAERVLLFGEVDPIQNARVDTISQDPDNGAPPTTDCVSLSQYAATMAPGYPCTLDYNPMFLLINGEPSVDLIGADAVGQGAAVLLRMANAGLRSHTPSIVGVEMGLVAEDGNRYPTEPDKLAHQSAVLLAAGKTIDTLIAAPSADINLSIFDRMPTFSNETLPNGGALGSLQVGAGGPVTPPGATAAVADFYTYNEDSPLSGKNVLDNDIGLSGATVTLVGGTEVGGTATVNADGTFNFAAAGNGTASFDYQADQGGSLYVATVTLDVAFTNDAPTARDDAYSNATGAFIDVSAASGVLDNDSDPDGDTLTATIGTSPSGGTLSCAADATLEICSDGSFVYTPTDATVVTNDSFTYTATAGTDTDTATVTLTTNPVADIELTVVEADNPAAVVSDFHWVVEEDATWQADPDHPQQQTLGTNFHTSYMPVIAQGDGAAAFADVALDPDKHYYVSVLPQDAYADTGRVMGGARIYPGDSSVTVRVNNLPTPSAQISMIVFNDNGPTNGAVDGGEVGLGGFQVTLEDAGGRYGASAGMMSQDMNGDPLRNALPCFDGIQQPAAGIILSCPDTPENQAAGYVGRVLIQNLWPAKYGVIVTAPTDQATDWVQTSTIEGTKVIDAWVKANEPAFFQEFGPPGFHAFVGFVNPQQVASVNPGGANTVTGTVTNMHMSRPPEQTLWDSGSFDALSHTRAWVGLNSAAGNGPNYAAVQADENGNFTIPNIPDGEYQLVVWDQYLDQIIAYKGVSLPTGASVGNVPVFQWFARLENNVFHDLNGNGVLDAGEEPMLEQNINLRWRDGTVYQAFPTDTEGFVPFDQVFPFFHWLVAEVDYARYEATGATVTIDAGGDVSTTGGVLNPFYRDGSPTTYTSVDGDLTFGFQGFLGQTSIIDWGKRPWTEGFNGGISGIVYYAITRAESDPRLGAAEVWEPGVARAKVRLYKEVARPDGTIALVLVEETVTDSWDDSQPENCLGAHPDDTAIVGGPTDAKGITTKCYDGIRNFNQIRPGVFDGGYAFNGIPAGKYVVEVVPPPGYEIVKEEDVNVGFGELFAAPVSILMPGGALMAAALPDPGMIVAAKSAEPGLAQPPCVGDPHQVPDYLSLFEGALEPAPFASAVRPLCDRKQVILSDQGQAAADFFLFTDTPIAAHFTGVVLDDLAQEFFTDSPNFGEKWAPPFVPVSVRDYKGNEISRTYGDQWGRINGLVPSTYSANEPAPSGMSPSMLQTCKNDSGPILDTDPTSDTYDQLIVDPHFNPAYGTFCYTFQYMPGTTTYLDTPVIPVSAFASGYNAVDCAPANGTPRIERVEGTADGPLAATGGALTIHSMSSMAEVPNPAYEGPLATGPAAIKTIQRDFSFGGTEGTVYLNGVALDPDTVDWGSNTIVWNIPGDFPTYTYQLEIETAAGVSTINGITVEVEGPGEAAIRVPQDYATIQAAIDDAAPGDLILVSPGEYEEQLILWKPVRLQGAGAGSTFINGLKRPTETLVAWREKMDCVFGVNAAGCDGADFDVVDPLPNQVPGAAGFTTEEGATITVVGVFDERRQPSGQHPANSFRVGVARIDGFTITGGDTGGGIFVNGNAHRVEIGNNHLFGNSSNFHGGIRFGRPGLVLAGSGPFGFNENANVHHNAVTQNSSYDGAGAGISIATGTDNYNISSNFVCGNLTQGDGAGIGHYGLSDGGTIADNTIVFNQSFLQGATVSGGGLFIGGEPLAIGEGTITKGSGNVAVTGNLIQGNHAASGHGGGVRAQFVNGQDVLDSIGNNGRASVNEWFQLTLTGNTIVNNIAGWSGGAISLQDTAKVSLQDNTIAHNDSTATVAATFTTGDPNISAGQVAGLSSAPHSAELLAAIPDQNNTGGLRFFSNPELIGNLIWENRSFYYDSSDGTADLVPILSQATVGECVAGATYFDVGVLGGAYTIVDGGQVVTGTDPGFTAPYCNGGRGLVGAPGPMLALPALDEGGATWIDVRWGPLTPMGDYN
jgi:FtsP/CotA-like multicopper oxidase with cupredoxin domain